MLMMLSSASLKLSNHWGTELGGEERAGHSGE